MLTLPRGQHGLTTVSDASFLPDGTFVAITNAHVSWWNADTGALLRTIERAGGNGAVSPDGRLVVALDNAGVAHRWDLRDGRTLDPLSGAPLDGWTRLAFTPDSRRILAARYDGSLVGLFDAQSGAFEASLARDAEHPSDIAFSRDGSEVIVALNKGPVRRFSLRDGAELSPLEVPFSSASGASVVAMRDGSWVCCRNGALVRLHPDEAALRWRRDDLVWGVDIAVSPDESVVAAGFEGALRRYDANTGARIDEHGHSGPVQGFRVTDDGALVSFASSWPPELFRWRDDGAEPEVLSCKVGVAPVALSLDGARVAFVDREQAMSVASVDDIASPDPAITAEDVTGARFLPDGRIIVGRSFGACVIDPSTGREAELGDGSETVLAVSEDASVVATLGRFLKVRRLSDGAEVMSLKPAKSIASAAFTSDSATLVTLSHGDGLRSFEVANGAPRAKLLRVAPGAPLSPPRLERLAMTRDGAFALIGDHRGELYGADLEARRACSLGPAHRGDVRAIEIDEARGVARTSGADTVILTWDLSALRARVTPRKREGRGG